MKGRLERFAIGRTITEIQRVAIDSVRLRLDQNIILEVSAYRPYRGADAQVRLDFIKDEPDALESPASLSVEQLLQQRKRLENEITQLIEGFENRTQIQVEKLLTERKPVAPLVEGEDDTTPPAPVSVSVRLKL